MKSQEALAKLVLVEAELERVSLEVREKSNIIIMLEAKSGRIADLDRLRNDYTQLSITYTTVENERNALLSKLS